MTITSLRINNFRNLSSVDLAAFAPGLNVICGNNGSGKTSFLEAIHYLSMGRSFRSTAANQLIRHEMNEFSLFSQVLSGSPHPFPIGISRQRKGLTQLRIAEQNVSSMAELAAYLPVRVINSQSHHLLDSGPVFRRKFLDWGLFYQSEHFLACYRDFAHVLKQRNAILRKRGTKKELEVWTKAFIQHAVILDKLRNDYVAALAPHLKAVFHELLGFSLDLAYLPGWESDMDLTALFDQYYPDESKWGYTLLGPHRADLTIRCNGLSVKHFLSRGQQKLLICAMIAAQGKLLNQQTKRSIIYLIDDLPAELDLLSREKLINLLSFQQNQAFITAIDHESICDFLTVDRKVFHVEHGRVVER